MIIQCVMFSEARRIRPELHMGHNWHLVQLSLKIWGIVVDGYIGNAQRRTPSAATIKLIHFTTLSWTPFNKLLSNNHLGYGVKKVSNIAKQIQLSHWNEYETLLIVFNFESIFSHGENAS
jgi:hypothetical protein